MDRGAGVVYLVGAGPGDPGLLTRRGAEVLAQADVVVYDHLASPACSTSPRSRPCGSARASRSATARSRRTRSTPSSSSMRGRAGGSSGSRGATPTSSAGGPRRPSTSAPPGSPFEVVPGVTAGVGRDRLRGHPVTHRDAASAVAFVTGHDDPEAPATAGSTGPRLARFPGTLVVYMGVTRLRGPLPDPDPRGEARRHPRRPDRARAPWPSSGRSSRTLADLPERVAEAGLGPPALLVVGDVVAPPPRPLPGSRSCPCSASGSSSPARSTRPTARPRSSRHWAPRS